MFANISLAEMTLLRYLQAHSGGSGERIWLDPKPIMHDLHVSESQFAEDAAALQAHGFAGVRYFTDANDVRSSKCSAIWVTKIGNEFLRRSQVLPAPTTNAEHV